MSSYETAPGAITEELLDPFAYGRGFFDVLAGAAPGAGSDFTFTESGQWLTRVISAAFRLTTSAVAANRIVTCNYEDGNGNTLIRAGAAVAVLANSTQDFSGTIDGPSGAWNTGTPVFFSLAHFFIEPGRLFRIHVANIDAGDTLTNIFVGVERFPTGPRGYPEGRVGPHGRRQAQLHRTSHHVIRR